MTGEEQRDRKLELIAQLLAKAERTTPEEAEALTEHAERLMIKYGIEQAVLDEKRAKLGQATEQIVELSMFLRGTYARDLRDGLASVVFALGLRPLQTNRRGGQILYIIGFESDAEQAVTLLRSLELQAVVAMRDWWKTHRVDYRLHSGREKEKARGAFIRAFGLGAAARVAANRAHEVHDAGTGTELVLASRERRVAEHVASGGYGRARVRDLTDGYATRHGYLKGQEANTGEKSLGYHRAITR